VGRERKRKYRGGKDEAEREKRKEREERRSEETRKNKNIISIF
jgi:hypothetical protein